MGCDRRRTLTIRTTLILTLFLDVTKGQLYSSPYDSLNIDDVLNHKRLVHHYTACLLNRGPCPPQGAELKRILPEALETNCAKCTQNQKFLARNTIKRLKKEYPNLYKELSDFYDPTGEMISRFLETFHNESENNVVPLSIDKFGDSENNVDGSFSNDGKSLSSSTTARIITRKTTPPPPPPPPRNGGTKTYRDSTTFSASSQSAAANPGNGVFNVNTPILGSIAQLGTQVLKAGTQVAGMFLSTVQALVGP